MSTMSAGLIAALLRRPAPTPEQEQVITAPLGPGVVVAGAGSGKTETMAARVVWLVANGHVHPTEVLGLTFTRKAASELGARVRHRLASLEATGRVVLAPGEPTVSTYDGFAGRIVADHGARLGLEPGRRLLTPAGAWQRAARLVAGWDGPMDDVASAPVTVIADVLDLHEQAASHLADLDDVAAHTRAMRDLVAGLPPGRRQRKPVHSRLEPVLRAQQTRLAILALVEQYRADLVRDDLADFATIAAEAAQVARSFPEVGEHMRGQFRLVLLDEFQDTSYAQLELLLSLFGAGHAVTAVGDPFQSIYAWRGANADTLRSFAEQFGGGRDVQRYSLRTSFRNTSRVLDAANVVARPLREQAMDVDTLVPAAGADPGEVRVALHRTKAEQAVAVGDTVAALWRGGSEPGAETERPSIGVLVRKRDELPDVESALRERGVPVEVVGLDGLLTVPEVADAVALLQVAVDPARGDALMRLLTGPALQLGPRDLDALARWARRLSPEPAADQPSWQVPRAGIVECLSTPPPPGWLSDAARARLTRLAGVVAHVRHRLNRPLPDVVGEAVVALGLHVESLSRAARTGGAGASHLDRIVEEAAQFADVARHPGVAEFLDYLAAAAEQERGLRRAPEAHMGSRVQLLTVHAAKGLEWDVVVVVGLTESGFPSRSRTGAAWLSDAGTLPYALRGDAARLAHLARDGVENQSDLATRVDDFVERARENDLDEERRLAYVALTRARSLLLCHGYRWGTGQRSLDPSRFLVELSTCPGVVVDEWVDEPGPPPDTVTNAPRWPADPLGPHRTALDAGAMMVRDALAAEETRGARAAAGETDAAVPSEGTSVSERAATWSQTAEMLLAERSRRAAGSRVVQLPAHLTATQLVAARRDPQEFLDRLRRPMPVRPLVEARQGTAFHTWVEQRYGSPRLLDIDELPGAADALDSPAGADLAELQAAFLASPWAEREPVEIEAPFEMVVDGTVVRGRADAVFRDADGLVVVDWKTGPPPTGSAEVQARSAQLAAYRQAFATLYGLPPHKVRAVFHHVRENVTVEEAGRGVDVVTEVVSGLISSTGPPATATA